MKEKTTPKGPRIPKTSVDFVDLWKYFESRGADVKNTMFSTVTWLIGFAAVIAGIIVKECLVLQPNAVVMSRPLPLVLLSLAGFGIIFYADVLIRDFGNHINRNFDRADRAREADKSLDELLHEEGPEADLPSICKRIRRVVRVFGTAFLVGIAAGVYKMFTP
jgi:hypothetical protein